MGKPIRPLSLVIDSDLWKAFKRIVPRVQTLNDAIVELIKERVKEKGIK